MLHKQYDGFQPSRGISRYTLPPHTTKRRITTNLKTKNHQNCQKIKLHVSPTAKKLKKTFIQSGRRGRDRKLGQRGSNKVVDQAGEAAAGRQDFPHSQADKLGGTTGE